MSDPFEAVKKAERTKMAADNALSRARAIVEAAEIEFRKSLPVGRNQPCSVGIMPSGKVAVHALIPQRDESVFYIVTPGYVDDSGKPRKP